MGVETWSQLDVCVSKDASFSLSFLCNVIRLLDPVIY